MLQRARYSCGTHRSSQPHHIDDPHDILASDISDIAWILVIEKEVCL